MKRIAIIILILLTSACTNSVKFERWSSAQYNIKGIRKIAFENFTARLNANRDSSYIVPTYLENGLRENGYFEVGQRITEPMEPLIKIDDMKPGQMLELGKEKVDAVVRGEIRAYYVDTDRSTKKITKEETEGYETVRYDEGGVQKTKQVPKKVTKTYDSKVVKKKASVDFSVEVINIKEKKVVGEGRFTDYAQDSAEGDSADTSIDSDKDMLDKVMKTLTPRFVKEIAPHKERYSVKLIKIDRCKDAIKQAKKGEWRLALDCWEGIIPESAQALYNIGVFYEGQGDYTSAYDHYRKALRLNNDDLYFKSASRANAYMKDIEKLKEQTKQ